MAYCVDARSTYRACLQLRTEIKRRASARYTRNTINHVINTHSCQQQSRELSDERRL